MHYEDDFKLATLLILRTCITNCKSSKIAIFEILILQNLNFASLTKNFALKITCYMVCF